MWVELVQRVSQSKRSEDTRIGDEVGDAGVVVRAGLVAEQACCIGVPPKVESGFQQHCSVDPIDCLLHAVKMFIRIAAGAEA